MSFEKVLFSQVVETITNKISLSKIQKTQYISTENMLINCGGIQISQGLPTGLEKLNHFLVGDTLFSNIRTYFRKVWRAKFEGGASSDVLIFRPQNKHKLDPTFLYYVASSPAFIAYTDRTSKGAKMPRGDKEAIGKYEFLLPSIFEQHKISLLLKALDDRIELFRETNKTLEEIAQALFKSWFVDFDLVRAKQEGERYASMDDETTALFPDSLEKCDLGEKPKGWKTELLGNLVVPKRGQTITKAKCKEGNVPVVAGGLDPAYFHNQSNVLGPVITISASGANAGFVRLYQENIWASDCSYISNKQSTSVFYWYLLLKDAQEKIYLMQQGAAQPHIYPSDLMRLNVFYPNNIEIIRRFNDVVTPLFERIGLASKEIYTLANLRDTLVPRLIAGQIKLPDVAEQIDAETV